MSNTECSSRQSEDINLKSLSTIFQEGLDMYNHLGCIDEPSNSPKVQDMVKKAIKIFENCTQVVSLTGVFSTNEIVEEVATTDLKYFLLPALLGSLHLKLTSGDRSDIITVAEIYFKDFLQRTNNYSLSNYKFKEDTDGERIASETPTTGGSNRTDFQKLEEAVNTRANKIQRFKEQKELKYKMEYLKKAVDRENCDEDDKRRFFTTMIKLFIYDAIEELDSINQEKPILEHMARVKKDNPDPPPKKQQHRPKYTPLKPVIITKDALQKAVYGAGYPGLPTMTVDEFYDKRVRDGVFPDPTKPKSGPMSMQEASLAGINLDDDDQENKEKEDLLERDDDEYIARMRAMDEHKDTHRRGWGNRMNRS